MCPKSAYVDALVADLEFALPSIWGRRIFSVFIGGGTPSLFSAAAIDRLLAAIRARVPLAPDAEITLEANPGTFEREKFSGIPRGGRQPAVARHPELRSRASARARAGARRKGSARGRRSGARDLRQRQLRSHVCAAAADDCARRRPTSPRRSRSRRRIFRSISSRSSRIRSSIAIRRRCRMTMRPPTSRTRSIRCWPRRGIGTTKRRRTRARAASAGTISTTGGSATISASARARIPSFRFPDRIVRQIRFKQPRQYLERATAGAPLLEE